jgi:hypothetical protein
MNKKRRDKGMRDRERESTVPRVNFMGYKEVTQNYKLLVRNGLQLGMPMPEFNPHTSQV